MTAYTGSYQLSRRKGSYRNPPRLPQKRGTVLRTADRSGSPPRGDSQRSHMENTRASTIDSRNTEPNCRLGPISSDDLCGIKGVEPYDAWVSRTAFEGGLLTPYPNILLYYLPNLYNIEECIKGKTIDLKSSIELLCIYILYCCG